MSRSLRVLFTFALAVLSQSGCDTPHSTVECTSTIPCPDGMECTPDGICVLVLPYDANIDARPIRDAGPADAAIDASTVCGDGVCLGSETCLSCSIDCGDCPMSCGDGVCQPGVENCGNCAVDCGACPGTCGDGACDDDEDCFTCTIDCGPCTGCDHGVCDTGAPLDEDCEPCTQTVCAVDPFCCTVAWDAVCVDEAQSLCLTDCSTGVCGDGACNGGSGETCATCEVDCGPCTGCDHNACLVGGPLDPVCWWCVAAICDLQPSCCTTSWDPSCVLLVEPVCGVSCGENCGDGLCLTDEDCTSCPSDCCVCGNFTCETAAGEDCATCAFDCGSCGGDCGDGACSATESPCTCEVDCGDCSCAHEVCESGGALADGCDMCVTAICDVDPFCCTTAWDTICVSEVGSICGLTCGGDTCGDFVCSPGEDCMSCPTDCGPCPGCGDGFCDAFAGETCDTCTVDCGPCTTPCGDGVCAPGETACTCELDCGDCTCAHDICTEGPLLDASCDMCVAAICATDSFCCTVSWDAICVMEVTSICGLTCGGGPTCGDMVCSPGEDCMSCPTDCGPCAVCGDGVCNVGEDCATCVADCGGCSATCPDITLPPTTSVTVTGSTVGAGLDFGGATCGAGGAMAPEVTYLYQVPVTGSYTIDTAGSTYDTLLYLRGGTDCLGAQIACDDDAGPGNTSQIVTTLTAGQQINIIVDGFGSQQGNYVLNITGPADVCGDGMCTPGEDCLSCPMDCGPCPPGCGDMVCSGLETCTTCPTDCGPCPPPCVDEDLGSTVPVSDTGSTVGAGNEMSGATCGGGGGSAPDVVYEWTAPSTGNYRFDTVGSAMAFDTLLYIRNGTCTGAQLGCNDDTPGLGNKSRIDVMLTAGQTVVVVVDGFGTSSGNYTLNISAIVPPTCGNGTCGAGETCTNCPGDCGPCMPTCGDMVCGAGETCTTCPGDCGPCPPGCGNGVCSGSETCTSCPGDCGPCGGTCDHSPCITGNALDESCDSCAAIVCMSDPFCCNTAWDGICVSEAQSMCGSTCPTPGCGDGACMGGETCTTCPSDCGPCPPGCGDGTCGPTENCSTCSLDCGPCAPTCGDMVCSSAETCTTCPTDCGACPPTCGNGVCNPGETCSSCPGDCGACPAVCGDTVCNGTETCTSCPGDCGPCTGGCDHSPCVTGSALDESCDPCAAIVCASDSFCCSGTWDAICVSEAQAMCGGTCPPVCGDGSCGAGESCSSCPGDCGVCPAVCGNGTCEATEGCTTCPSDCGVCPGACGDGVCSATETCSSCASDCGTCGGTCAHDVCVTGAALEDGCNDCVTDVCAVDSFCCNVSWDSLCASEAASICGEPCDTACGNGTCGRGETCSSCSTDCGACPCPHDVCTEGGPLSAACGDCAAAVCAFDPFCCATAWDDRCVGHAETICGVSCGGFCGDFTCGPGENCTNCPGDCGGCPTPCGDGLCTGAETCTSCPSDCGPCPTCGNGACEFTEDCFSCPTDCGSCGVCGDMFCDGFAGEDCGTCPTDCGSCGPVCGDFTCDPGENCLNCAADCGSCGTCGDGFCIAFQGETCTTCPGDCGPCGACGNGVCGPGEGCWNCNADCGTCLANCGDGACVTTEAEFCFSCPADCGPCGGP